jgi:Spy/CpxP family protein refolding chaperone
MKRKWFVALAILAIASVGVFITDQVTQAQRPDRPGAGARQGGPPGGGGMMNPASLVESSWAGVAFAVKVDDQTLLKARPIHQKAWDDINKMMEEARAAGDFQGMRDQMTEVRNEFRTNLEKVLTKDQLAKLDEWQRAQMERGGMRRGGGGGQGRPGGPDGN